MTILPSMFEQIIGKKSQHITVGDIQNKISEYENVHIDLGTGDGLFAWRLAKECPDMFVFGIDAARESLQEGSARAAKKPARGGTPNAAFLCMNVLEMPEGLEAKATSVSINFPWGSLLQAAAMPNEEFMNRVHGLLKDNGKLDMYINLYVFQKEDERLNLGLPELNEDDFINRLKPAIEKIGFEYLSHKFIPEGEKVDVASTWGGRLTRNSKRPTIEMHFQKAS